MALLVEKLRRDHRVEQFDCGKDSLNRFLIRCALQSQLSNSSQTYVALSDEDVIGFYTLVFGDVVCNDAPERLSKGGGSPSHSAHDPGTARLFQELGRQRDWLRSF